MDHRPRPIAIAVHGGAGAAEPATAAERAAAVDAAAAAGFAILGERVAVHAGLVLVDAAGRVGIAHTTPAMPAAFRVG